jgi:murein L,D-transpeptidase YafK
VATLVAVAGSIFKIWRAIATLVLLLASGAALADPVDETIRPSLPAGLCPESGDVIAVITRKRELWLCVDGAPAARFEVALGQGGLDKRQKGDRRTPLGTYVLGTPRPSGRYGVFIPIVYPTPEQAAQGLTGGDVGIHGPPRKLPEPEYPTTAFDWTLGCVATGTDADIEVVATFVRERRPLLVVR